MLEYIATAFPGRGAPTVGRLSTLPGAGVGTGYDRRRRRCQYSRLREVPGARVERPGRGLLQSKLQHIEPLERRAAWAAVVDGLYDERAIAAIKERLKFPLRRVESALEESAWLAGASYSVADIDAFALLVGLPGWRPELVNPQSTPRIVDFLRRMNERKAVQAALATSRSGKPLEAYVPGAEPSRWG